jgi:glucosamine--fructose-6-phosphate aminotransferase (isomerizing)
MGVSIEKLHTFVEIRSQPDIWESTTAKFLEFKPANLPRFEEYDQVIFTGCGSTYYLSIWAARSLQSLKGGFARPLPSSEIMLYPGNWIVKNKKSLLVAVSRSGSTSETIQAVTAFKKASGGDVIGITCYPESELAKTADLVLNVPAGQETSIAQTRSFTSMMLAVSFLISSQVPGQIGKYLNNKMKQAFRDYERLVQEIGQANTFERFFFLGSGARYGLACEAMLKLKEMSLTYSEAYHFLEFRHGPMSMIDNKTIVVGLLGSDNLDYEMAVLSDMKKLGAQILAVTPHGIDFTGQPVDYGISINAESRIPWIDVLYLPLLQLLACARSVRNGLNPDQPENLNAVVILEK